MIMNERKPENVGKWYEGESEGNLWYPIGYPKCNGMLLKGFQKRSFVVLKYVGIMAYQEQTGDGECG